MNCRIYCCQFTLQRLKPNPTTGDGHVRCKLAAMMGPIQYSGTEKMNIGTVEILVVQLWFRFVCCLDLCTTDGSVGRTTLGLSTSSFIRLLSATRPIMHMIESERRNECQWRSDELNRPRHYLVGWFPPVGAWQLVPLSIIGPLILMSWLREEPKRVLRSTTRRTKQRRRCCKGILSPSLNE